jgi:transcriptional regulator with XRE-family HTH domain
MQESARRQEEICKKLQVFSDRLKSRRHRLGISQETLAINASVSPRSIATWESGTGNIPQGTKLNQLATALQVQVSWLLGEEDAAAATPMRAESPPYRTSQPPDWRARALAAEAKLLAIHQLSSDHTHTGRTALDQTQAEREASEILTRGVIVSKSGEAASATKSKH